VLDFGGIGTQTSAISLAHAKEMGKVTMAGDAREFDPNSLPDMDQYPDDPPTFGSALKLLQDGKQLAICHMGFRFDAYSGWCGHTCSYCYARGIDLRYKRYNYDKIKVADLAEIKRRFDRVLGQGRVSSHLTDQCIAHRYPIRAGTNTDCFQPIEKKYRITYRLIDEILNPHDYPYCVCTKNEMVADPEYMEIYRDNATFQFSLATLKEEYNSTIERGASTAEERLRAMEKLAKAGHFVGVRISPWIPEYMDDTEELIKRLADAGCRHVISEMLRVSPILNHIMFNDSGIDFADQYRKMGVKLNIGYYRYPLEKKIEHQKRLAAMCEAHGLTFATCADEDPSFHSVKNCCGFDGNEKFSGCPTATYDTAFRICKENGRVSFEQLVDGHWSPNPKALKDVWDRGYLENVLKSLEFDEATQEYKFVDCNPTLKNVNG
jgi:DNA repair photolyase